MNKEVFRQQMKKARRMMSEGDTAGARKILEALDKRVEHPTIGKWLAELDDIELGTVEPKKKGGGCIRRIGFAVLAGCGVIFALAWWGSTMDLPDATDSPEVAEVVSTETPEPVASEADRIDPVPTNTDTPTVTSTQTNTPTMTSTATITATSTITNTPEPSPTFTLEELAENAFADVFGRSRVDEIERLIVNDIVVTIRFPLTDFSAWAARTEAELELPILVCRFREAGLVNRTYQITGTIAVVDGFGNGGIAEGVETIVPWSVVEQINCDAAEMYQVNLASIAERYDVHPLIQED